MPDIDYSHYIQEYMQNEPATLAGFTPLLAKYRGNISVWRGMLCYSLWRTVYKNLIPIGGVRDYVNENMGEILGAYSDNKDYILSLAGVVDIIIADMWRMHRDAETPYLDTEGEPITPEMVIFNPSALTHAYTFKGFWKETFKWEENGTKTFDEAYEIRETLLNMFLHNTRDEIKAFIAEIRNEVIVEENGGVPVTVIEVAMSGDELENMIVTLELDAKAFAWLNGQLQKRYAVTMYRVGDQDAGDNRP